MNNGGKVEPAAKPNEMGAEDDGGEEEETRNCGSFYGPN